MSTLPCPHCGAEGAADAAFCASCGKAMPASVGTRPRIVHSTDYATSRAGQIIQAEELARHARKASGALIVVGILQAVFGTFLVVMAGVIAARQDAEQDFSVGATAIVVYGIAVLFLGLGLWARRNPLPAAITGLVVFVTVHALDAVADPTALIRGIVVKVIIVLILIRAVSAGTRYQALMRSLSTTP